MRVSRSKKESSPGDNLTTELGGVDNVSRAMKRATSVEITKLEKYCSFLATTASSAPFVGLFGTVWGIMNAFRGSERDAFVEHSSGRARYRRSVDRHGGRFGGGHSGA